MSRKTKHLSLTANRERFCQNIVDGMNQTEAYRHAYNNFTGAPNTIQVKASQLMNVDMIKVRINELRQQLSVKAIWRRENSVKALVDIVMNDPDAKTSDRIKAISELNKMHGWQSVDITNSDGSLAPKTINFFYGEQK